MSNIYLTPISYAAGAITAAYGAYSYCTAKGKHKKQQMDTAKRVIAVGLGLLAVGAALQYFGKIQGVKIDTPTPQIEPKILEPIPEEYLKPYVESLKGRALPKTGAPITQFPPHLSKFPHPGLLTTKEGGICVLEDMDELPPLDECQETFTLLIKQIKRNMPDVYADGTSHSSRWGKGYGLVIDNVGYKRFNFGMDKTIVDNYGKGLKTAERLFLQDPDFANASESSIVDSIKELHRTFAENVKHKEPGLKINPGVFRTKELLVGDDKMELSLDGMRQALKENNGEAADFANLESWFAKIERYGEAVKSYSTPEEIATVKKVVHLPIDSKEVPSAMLGLAKKLKEIYSLVKNQIVHPIAPAAWVHQECGDIHAFSDINGRVCRTLANVVFQWGGVKGIVFPKDALYTAAIKADQKSAGSLVGYFVDVINWNAEQQKALNS